MRLAALLFILSLLTPQMGHAQAGAPETRTAAYFDRIAASPPQLRMFLQAMPKGADLHSHLGGSVYAEDLLQWAAADDLCITADNNRIVRPPCDAPGQVSARNLATNDYARYSRVIDALSTRGFEQGVGDPLRPGHDRFFAPFDGFKGLVDDNQGKALAVVREAAADNQVGYVELMLTHRAAQQLLDSVGAVNADDADFAALSAKLAPLLPTAVAQARASLDRLEAEAFAIGECKTDTPKRSCRVEVRYQTPALRTRPPAQVFAALAFAFALAQADSRFVGVNFTGLEHHPTAVRDYALHMRMLAFFKREHPSVRVSLHAGELTLGLVAPRDLRSHIRDAVLIAGSDRIGHGVDISYETDARELLKRMARDKIAVEINLTSNAIILGVAGANHPLALYRAAGVPVVLATDDQGLSRGDMTHEYLRAVREQGLGYLDLKLIARNGLEYAFLPGPSLWRSGVGGAWVPTCAALPASPNAACTRFLDSSPKALLQWRLERDLARFENEHL